MMAKTSPLKPAVPMVPAYMKTDAIQFDTSKAPWMAIAREELGKEIRERADDGSFSRLLYLSLVQKRATGGRSASLLEPIARQGMGAELGRRNAEITKYFDTLKTDPARDPARKGRSWPVAPVNEGTPGDWQVTAWCAAFVNWCLTQAGAPNLGYATADAWLRFGTPLPTPVYGCITVIPPAKNTGSTTGHVAFYTATKGEYVILLGGNQGDKISEMPAQANRVLGYRWPSEFNYFLLDRRSAVV